MKSAWSWSFLGPASSWQKRVRSVFHHLVLKHTRLFVKCDWRDAVKEKLYLIVCAEVESSGPWWMDDTVSVKWMENMHCHNNGISKETLLGYSFNHGNNSPVVFERAPLLTYGTTWTHHPAWTYKKLYSPSHSCGNFFLKQTRPVTLLRWQPWVSEQQQGGADYSIRSD